jgi:hypothetical protein
MKIRQGFVSNSSSASFVIDKTKLSALQVLAIMDHINAAQRLGMENVCDEEAWNVTEEESTINLHTSMDNFDMLEFLEKIGALKAIMVYYS